MPSAGSEEAILADAKLAAGIATFGANLTKRLPTETNLPSLRLIKYFALTFTINLSFLLHVFVFVVYTFPNVHSERKSKRGINVQEDFVKSTGSDVEVMKLSATEGC